MQFDLTGLSEPKTLRGEYLWPNELSIFKDSRTNSKIVLIPDGFLMPGQSDGGLIFSISHPLTKFLNLMLHKGYMQ